ncbi:hypothetical protein JHL17_13300 [Azospirillum sp. YIM B02556]|uniref:MotA/TolQ/ExbB proton channel domain-containing protein n=1 Tax=Azospirillum endophyticum TaxID=2800326 RepID=A0ABS1F4P4_9PROT|nr:hypothetical protein [Azospirillum endophyticum]MBK1838390.1 hypothetical protein [Azospirillum endophyticum]
MTPASGILQKSTKTNTTRDLSAFGITLRNWLFIWVIAIVAGALLYAATVIGSYYTMQSSMRTAPLPQFLGLDQSMISSNDAKRIAEGFRIASPEGVAAQIESAINNAGNRQDEKVKDVPALRFLTRLLAGNGRCAGNCGAGCIGIIENRVLRLLGGWPSSSELDPGISFQLTTVEPVRPVPSIDTACEQVRKQAENIISIEDILLHPRGLLIRQNPVAIPKLARELLEPGGCDAASETRSMCQLFIRVMQEVIDSDEVRLRRSLLVNLFYGWERLVVWILFFATLLALWVRGRLFKPIQRRWVAIQSIAQKGNVTDPLDVLNSIKQHDDDLVNFNKTGNIIRNDFLIEFMNASQQDMISGATERNVEKIAALHLDEIESERIVIDSMIAVFSVIGFVATLLGLIEALASANTIATTSGDERGAAILTVTTVLSSCFATTFLALVCMAGFSVINMIQGRHERNIIRGVELLLTRLISSHRELYLKNLQDRQAELDLENAQNEQLRADTLELEAAIAMAKAEHLQAEAKNVRNRIAKRAKRVSGTSSTMLDSSSGSGDAVL